MDLGRPIARHFARRPHEVDEPAADRTSPDPTVPDVAAQTPGRATEHLQDASAPPVDGVHTEPRTP